MLFKAFYIILTLTTANGTTYEQSFFGLDATKECAEAYFKHLKQAEMLGAKLKCRRIEGRPA